MAGNSQKVSFFLEFYCQFQHCDLIRLEPKVDGAVEEIDDMLADFSD